MVYIYSLAPKNRFLHSDISRVRQTEVRKIELRIRKKIWNGSSPVLGGALSRLYNRFDKNGVVFHVIPRV
jgi:hypothetical protein